MPDEPTAEMPVTPAPKPAPVPPKPVAKPAPPPVAAAPKPEPKAEPVSDNVIQVYHETADGLWYARIGGPQGLVGCGRDPHEALAECTSFAYRSQWQFCPGYKPK